jgi:hypothetical protein
MSDGALHMKHTLGKASNQLNSILAYVGLKILYIPQRVEALFSFFLIFDIRGEKTVLSNARS